MRVAVLDSGIHADHPHVAGGRIESGISLVDDVEDTIDRSGHGTAVAAVILEKAPGATLLPVKLFHRQLSTNADALVRGIEWAVERDARIINLSLGTANALHADRLGEAVRAALARGAIVVSARETDGVTWYPGSLDGAIGVIANAAVQRDEIRTERTPSGALRIGASIYPRPIPGIEKERNVSGISFAVANVSGFLARALEADTRPTADALLRDLG